MCLRKGIQKLRNNWGFERKSLQIAFFSVFMHCFFFFRGILAHFMHTIFEPDKSAYAKHITLINSALSLVRGTGSQCTPACDLGQITVGCGKAS